MKWVEPAGLVKFDFLGLKTLTVLETAVRFVAQRGIEIDLSRIPLDDAKTYEMLARGETVGVFQVESQGMRRALVDMRPDRFEDLIVLVALYRPGPMANIPTYCARKLGHEAIEYLHPKLEPILAPTYGIITYQEQVHADRARSCRLQSRQGRHPAPRHGQERSRRRWRRSAATSSPARSSAASSKSDAVVDLRRLREVRRIRLQQVAFGAVCAAHLPDRLYEGELSGGVPGGVDDARHGQYRQALRIPQRGGAARHQGRAAVGQSLGRRVRGGRATRSTIRWRR